MVFLVACSAPVQIESEELVPVTEPESIEPSATIKEAPESSLEEKETQDMPESLLTFNYLSVSGATIPQKVDFVTTDGVKIVGSYFAPSVTPAPTIMMLPMLGRTKGDYTQMARAFQNKGFAVLTIDLRGHGKSVYQDGNRFSYRDLKKEDWISTLEDIKAAKKFLTKQDEASSIGILGASLGANAALRYAVEDDDIAALVLLSPGLEYQGISTLDAVTTYGERPILILATQDDDYAAFSSEQLNDQATGPHKLVIYDGKEHGSDIITHHLKADDEIYTWFNYFLV